ncbi:hypothetical protein IAQ61_000306 [Plenodomus lingam]|uniref:uncharacterized protein n=1 Tax=Leptosphaeria maculans TaxID=5022 RepID=UPI0033187BEC|nr:hypothetical protein IAQ61_000306 [Plenodomus lingam]
MSPILTLLITLLAIITTTTTAHPTPPSCPPTIGPKAVHARLPPALDPNYPHTKWHAPPPTWYLKPWHMIYASNPQYTAFRNIQYDPSALDPHNPTLLNDLFSFQLPHNNTIHTTYGIDTLHPVYPGVLAYNATGIIAGATSEYSILAWGCDANAVPYYASYSTATGMTRTPAGIDVMSVSAAGVDGDTMEAVMGALAGLESLEVGRLVEGLVRMVDDGGREGLPRAFCDEYCKSNRNLIGLLG